MSANERNRSECPSLPKGWIREVVMRRNGNSAGKSDVYYYSPEGRKFRSKPQILQYFGDTLDLTNFDFRTGRLDATYRSKRRFREKVNETSFRKDFSRPTLSCPKRITKKSIEKKMVKFVKCSTSEELKTSNNILLNKRSVQEQVDSGHQFKRQHGQESTVDKEPNKPKQLFWQKRLQGLNAVDVNSSKPSKSLEIPAEIKSLVPGGNKITLFHSIISCLHNDIKVIGQNMSINALRKNPGIWCNPDQPFCPPFVITSEMVKEQERRVERSRKNLSDAVEFLKYIQDEEYESE